MLLSGDAASFFAVTVNSVESGPTSVGAYVTSTEHVFFSSRFVPVQPSLVIEKSDDPVSETCNAPVAFPPEFVTAYVAEKELPTVTNP